MGVGVRTGRYGNYTGATYDSSGPLAWYFMLQNAIYICLYFKDHGWTLNAIAGILGNMEAESTLNPGRWQSDDVGNTSGGYGLVQWTPATKYFEWCTSNNLSDPSEMDNNLDRIIYELENGIQWIATSEYSLSFEEFSKSTESAEYLASAFLKCYERAGVEVEETRRTNAQKWYEQLEDTYGTGQGETGDSGNAGSTKKNKRFNFILFNKRRKVY